MLLTIFTSQLLDYIIASLSNNLVDLYPSHHYHHFSLSLVWTLLISFIYCIDSLHRDKSACTKGPDILDCPG